MRSNKSTSNKYSARWSTGASRLVLLALAISKATALSQEYCASFNLGNSKQTQSSNFMTNGKCHDQCSGYAFAIVQDKNCWCTNYAPGDAQSGAACSKACPGYPYENCGNADEGLFGYIALGPQPAGTQGGSTPSSSPSQTPDSSTYQPSSNADDDSSQVTVQDTVTQSPSVETSVSSVTKAPPVTTSVLTTSKYVPVSIPLETTSSTPTTTSTPTTSSTSDSTTRSSSSTWKPTPVVTVETVTGKVRTMTVTPTEPPQSTQTVVTAADAARQQGFLSSPGKVAGTFVAVALILVAIAAGLIFLFWRRKRRQEQQAPLPSTSDSGGTPQRRPSRLSQMGLLGSQRERNRLPEIETGGWGPGNSAEKSPADTLDKRSSYPRMVDQRLEPTALWNPLHDNGSHVSVRSFRDDQDYSRRMLRVANPD